MRNTCSFGASYRRTSWPAIGLMILLMLAVYGSAGATTTVLNGSYAAPVGGNGSSTQQFLSSGSWQNVPGLPKFEWYFYADSVSFVNETFTISQIANLEFYTKDGLIANPTGLDFYLTVYTKPYVGGDASWYGNRLTGEPMYSYNYSRSAVAWNHWNTSAGTNQLAWVDQNHSPIGAYGAPTWQAIQAGPINWQTYFPTFPVTNINYANQPVKLISLSTGSGWDATFDGYVDAISITLTDSRVLTFDLEGNPVHNITHVADYSTLTAALNAAQPGDEIHVDPNSLFYEHNIPITKPVTLIGVPGDATPGPGANAPIVDGQNLPNNHYGFLFGTGAHDVIISGFEVRNFVGPLNGDGDAFQAWYANTDHVTITDNYMHNIAANGVLVGSDSRHFVHSYWTITRNVLTDFGPPLPFNGTDQGYGLELTNTSNGLIEDNIIDAGTRGPGMAIRVSGRLAYQNNITVSGNRVRGAYERCAIQINAYDIEGAGSTLDGVTVENNDFEISYAPRTVYLRDDYSGGTAVLTNVVIHDNRLISTDNHLGVESLTDQIMNCSGNWWGDNTPAGVAAKMVGPVDYAPWLYNGADLDSGPGFHGDFSVLYVDDNSPQSGTVGRIQEAITMVSGSTVNVAAGTYEEQLHITTNNLNLVGAGVNATFINSPVTLPLYFSTSAANHPVIWVDGATGVSISNLTLDGLGRANGNARMEGIAYWNAGGSISNVHVNNIRNTPFTGQDAVAVYAYNNSAGPYTLNVTDVAVDGYQKGGVVMNGNGNLTANLLRVTATGAGATTTIAQNGIQFYGSSGTVNDCDVAGNAWIWTSGIHWVSTGCLFIEANVTVSGGCTAVDNQIGYYYSESSGSVTGGSIVANASTPDYSAGLSIANDDALAGGNRPHPQPLADPISISNGSMALDDVGDESVSVSGVTMTGTNPVGSWGVDAWNSAADLILSVTGNTITGWDKGISIARSGGTVSSATISGNSLSNTNNAEDNTTGHTYANNCWSDFGTNSGFPLQYNVAGGGNNADYTPGTDCNNIDLVMSSNLIGSGADCRGETLYLTFDGVGYNAAQMFVVLPTGLDAAWAAGTQYVQVLPSSNAATNLVFAGARRVAGNQLEVNVQWGPSYSDGNDAKYIAAIPLTATGSNAHGTDFTISLSNTYSFWTPSGPHSGSFTHGVTGLSVDFDVPAAMLGGGTGETTCNAYSSASEFAGALSVAMNALGTQGAPVSPLSSATISLGATTWTIPTINGSFPNGSETPNVWDTMTEGCNSFTLTVTDAECNSVTTTPVEVVKDISAPTATVTWSQAACYNNEPSSLQYGGSLIAAALGIDASVGSGTCMASSGMLQLSYNGNLYPATPVTLPTTTWPDAGDAADLWSWIVNTLNINGTVSIEVVAKDCAGNELLPHPTFSICVDVTPPTNSFSYFDARPTSDGVWLKWAWATDDAVEAQIYRKGEGDYPVYAGNLWDDDNNYAKSHVTDLTGWTLVATLAGGVNSHDFSGTHGGPLSDYWKDATVGPRDIYRYVTFVKDAAGNWSQVTNYALNVNKDRSTNYWLGDFAPNIDGVVNTADLGVLSQDYFETTIAGGGTAANQIDIGAENNENGYGKGIPNPDQLINFDDLVPFSFNFGVVGNGGFLTRPPDGKTFENLDGAPVVLATRSDESVITVGSTFAVTVSLGGNDHAVKAVEAVLNYNPEVLELVSATPGALEVSNGIPWSTAKAGSKPGTVAIAAAAMGQIATMNGDGGLAVLEFRWKSNRVAHATIEMPSVKMSDGTGAVISGSGTALVIGAEGLLPTAYALFQNYPNPFNPSTHINFDLKESGFVTLKVFNVLGQNVATLVNTSMEAGHHTVNFDASNLSSGMYIYKIEVNGFTALHKMMLMR